MLQSKQKNESPRIHHEVVYRRCAKTPIEVNSHKIVSLLAFAVNKDQFWAWYIFSLSYVVKRTDKVVFIAHNPLVNDTR